MGLQSVEVHKVLEVFTDLPQEEVSLPITWVLRDRAPFLRKNRTR
jgi:hypothetical protein